MKLFDRYLTDDYKHIVFKILCLKLKIKNLHINLYKKADGTNTLLNYIVDINNIPKTKGKLRQIQLQILEMLKLFDDICKRNNINYWIESGTLLGAVRHKGFIPWDDDVDVCILRDDVEKLNKILDEELKGNNL